MRFNPIPNSCAMVRRATVLDAGGFDPRYLYAMDYDLWLRLAERGTIATIDEPLAVRVMGGANVAARKEWAQTAETVRLRIQALRRRHTIRGASGLALPLVSLATPGTLKRARRRRLGQAP
jgi:GT2 family glycosyltransferase